MSAHERSKALKKQQRSLFAQQRSALAEPQRVKAASLLASHLGPWLDEHAPNKKITATLPFGAELPMLPFLADLVETKGYDVLVPICLPERQLAFARWFPGVEMARCQVAPIDEPVGTRFFAEDFGDVDVMMVPAQAIDHHGYRLGHGGGYYDRFLQKIKALENPPKLVGMVYQQEFVPPGTFPVEEFDQAVDGVVTELGFNWMF